MEELIRKMQRDMVIQNYSPRTVECYLWHVKDFIDFFSKPVESLNEENIRDYLYHVKTDKQYSHSNLAQAFSAIKYLFRETLDMPLSLSSLKGAKRERKLPVVLSQDELKTLFSCVKNTKHRLILMTTYSAGLRLNEVTHLRVSDIDSKRMTIRVQQGKGKRDRYTLLSPTLLLHLRSYWKQHRPYPWLFPGRDKNTPLSDASVQRAFKLARDKAGIRKKASVHTLRHSFATHLLEQGVNLFTIKELLGHSSILTTLIYLHLQNNSHAAIVNPIDQMMGGMS